MRVLLLLLGALVAGAAAWSEGKVRVGVYSLDFPYCYVGEDGEITGMEAELARAVCGFAGLQCELVPIPVLEDRIPALQNGTVDALFAGLVATPKRAELVDFLRPLYTPYDLSLVALEPEAAELEAAGTFNGIRGRKVCIQEGSAAIQGVARFGHELVTAVDRNDVVEKLVAAECVAAVDESYGLQLRALAAERHNETLLVLPATEAINPMAPGAAVPKGQGGSELGQRLTFGLVAAMDKGEASEVLQLEQEFLVPNGIPPSPKTRDLVAWLTDLDGVRPQ